MISLDFLILLNSFFIFVNCLGVLSPNSFLTLGRSYCILRLLESSIHLTLKKLHVFINLSLLKLNSGLMICRFSFISIFGIDESPKVDEFLFFSCNMFPNYHWSGEPSSNE